MPHTVGEIMNDELFYVRPGDRVEAARTGLLGLSITAAPVLDSDRRPVGTLSLRDLCDPLREGDRVCDRMSAPCPSVPASEAVEAAARTLSRRGSHHVVVVDESGRAVGVASAVDFVRELVGLTPEHPRAFPHLTH
jgi:CBS domain-containing protein